MKKNLEKGKVFSLYSKPTIKKRKLKNKFFNDYILLQRPALLAGASSYCSVG
jgi:hypothetical protein